MFKLYWSEYKPLLLGALGLIVVTGFIYLSLALLNQAELRTDTQLAGKLTRLQLVGKLKHVKMSDIKKVLTPVMDTSVLDLDLEALQKELAMLPWVKQVTVGRIFPDSLKVHIKEQRPVARWNDTAYLNPWGEIFQVGAFQGSDALIQIKGQNPKEALQQYVRIKEILGKNIEKVEMILQEKQEGYQLYFSDGLKVVVGVSHIERRLERLTKILEHHRQYPNRMTTIDLRYRKGFAIKMKQKQGENNV